MNITEILKILIIIALLLLLYFVGAKLKMFPDIFKPKSKQNTTTAIIPVTTPGATSTAIVPTITTKATTTTATDLSPGFPFINFMALPPKKLTHTAFYANWAQFWDGPESDGTNSPNTFKGFINNVDKIIYGFLMFGVMANPYLICTETVGSSTLAKSCQFTISDESQKANLNNFFSLVKDTISDNSKQTILDFGKLLQNYVSGVIDIDRNAYVLSNSYDTFAMYPNQCFTGARLSQTEEIIGDLAGRTDCPSKGRLNDYQCFVQMMKLKETNPKLKVIASYGGWTWTHPTEGVKFSTLSTNLFTNMVSTIENRAEFIKSSHAFLTTLVYDNITIVFDGLDLDWEYPGQNDRPYDFYGLEMLIKEYKQKYPEFLISLQCSGFLSSDAVYTDFLPGYKENNNRNYPIPIHIYFKQYRRIRNRYNFF
jgi:hypothetical protein